MWYLQDFALIVGVAYATIPSFWLTLHPFTQRWRRHGRDSFRVILPLWLLYMLLALALTWQWRHTPALHLAHTLTGIPGVLLILTGLALYRASARRFTHVQLSGLAELEPERHHQELVTSGIRSRVRHPIYLGHLCELIGWTLLANSLALIALLAFAIVTGAVMLRLEDAELEDRFGDSYRNYRRRVPALIPSLRSK